MTEEIARLQMQVDLLTAAVRELIDLQKDPEGTVDKLRAAITALPPEMAAEGRAWGEKAFPPSRGVLASMGMWSTP